MVIYICKYTPVELLHALGKSVVSPGEEVEDFASADAYLHSSICAHARQLFTTLLERQKPGCEVCEGRKDIVLTTCCDSIRRVADTLPESAYETLTLLDLPHRADSAAAEFYERELERLIEVLEPKNGQPEELEVAAEMREARTLALENGQAGKPGEEAAGIREARSLALENGQAGKAKEEAAAAPPPVKREEKNRAGKNQIVEEFPDDPADDKGSSKTS